MVHNPLRQKAFSLRKQGKSYGEIVKKLNLSSKGTLSYWFRDFKISPKAKKRLQRNILLAQKRGLFAFNKKRTKKIITENRRILEEASKNIPAITKESLLLIGASLYWAEGCNRQEKVSSPCISFGNSDPKMVVLFLRFLREIMLIPEENLRPFIQIHSNISKEAAINFWAGTCKIPRERFYVTRQTSRASKGVRPYNSLPYGTLKLNALGRKNYFKIKGWINGLIRRSVK